MQAISTPRLTTKTPFNGKKKTFGSILGEKTNIAVTPLNKKDLKTPFKSGLASKLTQNIKTGNAKKTKKVTVFKDELNDEVPDVEFAPSPEPEVEWQPLPEDRLDLDEIPIIPDVYTTVMRADRKRFEQIMNEIPEIDYVAMELPNLEIDLPTLDPFDIDCKIDLNSMLI